MIFLLSLHLRFAFTQEGEASEQTAKVFEDPGMVTNEIQRFEQLRKELVELEKRVQESADGCLDEKVQMVRK